MIHFENIVRFFVILTGFTSLAGIFFFSKGLKNITIRYYFLGYLFLFGFHLTDLVLSYLNSTLDNISVNIYICISTVLYFIITNYVINTIRLTANIIKFKNDRIISLICLFIKLSYFVTYLISLGRGDLDTISGNIYTNLWTCGMIVQFPSFIICIFLLLRSYKKIENNVVKRMIKAFLIMILIYLPFMIFENVITNIISWYPADTDLRLYQINFIIWGIVSSYILFKSVLSSNVNINPGYTLSKREEEVIECLLKSESVPGISEQLFISPRTVEKHISNIYKKVGVNNRSDLIKMLSR